LQPEIEVQDSINPLERLQVLIEKLFPTCAKQSPDGFNPHLTVAHMPKTKIESYLKKLNSNWKPLSFVVKEVYLVSRQIQEIHQKEFNFQIRTVLPLGGYPLLLSNQNNLSPLLKNTDFSSPNFQTIPCKQRSVQNRKCTVRIGNVPKKVNEEELKQKLFVENGFEVVTIEVFNKYVCVELKTEADQRTAIKELNFSEYGGKVLKMRKAK